MLQDLCTLKRRERRAPGRGMGLGRGLQPASAFASTRALNDFARSGWRELKRRERRAPVQRFNARTVSGNSPSSHGFRELKEMMGGA